jgi:hypothetical protein
MYQYNNLFDINKRFGYADTPHYLFGHKGYPLLLSTKSWQHVNNKCDIILELLYNKKNLKKVII